MTRVRGVATRVTSGWSSHDAPRDQPVVPPMIRTYRPRFFTLTSADEPHRVTSVTARVVAASHPSRVATSAGEWDR